MKPDIHPDYRTVAVQDSSTGRVFLTGSTAKSDRNIDIDGATYPLIVVDVTSDSHPLWTGTQRTIDTAGRVERFQQKYAGFGGRAPRR